MVSAKYLLEIQMIKRLLILAGLLGTVACASQAPNHLAMAMSALTQANYPVAYHQILLAQAADPENAEIQKRAEEFRVLYNLDSARRLIQADKELEGIENLRRLLEEYPANKDGQRWLRKGVLKLAKRVRFMADEALASGLLAKAQQYYAQVLLLVPGNELAIEGLAAVEEKLQSRLDKADDVYLRAVDAKAELEWDRVLYLAGICREYDPSRRDAVSLERAASKRSANRLRESAEQLKKEGRWGAAAKTWRLAAGFAKDAGLPWAKDVEGIIDGLMEEMEGEQLLAKAELKIKAGRTDEADKLIEQADPLCHHNRFRVNALRMQSRDARISRLVAKGRRLERDYRYDEAIETYKQMAKLGVRGETFAKNKIASIEESQKELLGMYQEALKLLGENKKVEAKKILQDIHALNPRFKDVEKRLLSQ